MDEENIIKLVLDRNIHQITELLERDCVRKRVILIGAAYAAFTKQEEMLDVFINSGFCSVNDILMTAIDKSLVDGIEVLCRYGADVNYGDQYNKNTLSIAVKNHGIESIQKLITLGTNVNMINSDGDTVLTYISRIPGDYIKELQLLVSNGAVVNLLNGYGQMPVHIAVSYDNIETLKELIVLGADVNRRNCLGQTPLMMASHKGRLACTELLLSSGANPNIQCKTGETALMISLRNVNTIHCTDIVNLLCRITDLNLCNINGESVLFHAVYHNSMDIIECLVSNGADINVKNILGITPFLLAIGQGYERLAQYFIEMGCEITKRMIDPYWYDYPPLFCSIIMQLDTVTNNDNCEELNKLFFGAGETVNIYGISHPHCIAIEAMDEECMLLKSAVRRTIRNYLSSISAVNLIYKINNLPLPTSLKNYLCFW